MQHHNPRARRRVLSGALVTAASILATVLPAQTASGVVGPGVLTTRVEHATGAAAVGAKVTMMTGQLAGDAPTILGTALAGVAGTVSIDPAESDALVEQAAHAGGRLRTFLLSEADDALNPDALAKTVATVWLTLDQATGTFTVPPVDVQTLRPLPVFEATFLQQLGEQTLATAGTLADLTDPHVAKGIARLNEEMAKHGYVTDNEAVAYAVPMAEGVVTWITYSPENFVLRTDGDLGTYEVLPITTTGVPAVDTTDAGDAAEALTAPTGTQAAKGNRGGWSRHAAECFYVSGPGSKHRYHRNVCWRLDHQEMDTVKGTSFWQFHMQASGSAMNGNEMEKMWVQSEPVYGGAPALKSDGLSRPAATHGGSEGCETKEFSMWVESGEPLKIGASHTWSTVKCETYGPKMFPEPGRYASIWWGNPEVEQDVYREVMLKTPVSTKTKDGTPRWSPWSGQHVRS